MIRFGMRLVFATGREALARLVTVTAAVVLGSALLLAALAGINGVDAQNQRYSWLNSRDNGVTAAGIDPLVWTVHEDYYDGQIIGRVDVAATGPHAPLPPGIPRLPGPGEYYASPALAELLSTVPSGQLAVRFPGHQVGVIGAQALPAPNSLIIIVGRDLSQLSAMPDARRVSHIESRSPSDCGDCFVGINANGKVLILSVVLLAMLFPLLIFIGTATRLSAARREQRYAAMRLIGATPRQIATLATVESVVASVIGVALGFGLFFLIRGPMATIPFTGAPFFASDLSLRLWNVLAIGLGVPLAAAAAARVGLRRLRISPLGVSRRTTPRPPRAWRVIPLLAGLAELFYIANRWAHPASGHQMKVTLPWLPFSVKPDTAAGQAAALLPGFLLIMVGLVLIGPWLTMVISRILARRAHRPAALIASRRMTDNPHAAFRTVSGLILALFITSVATGVMNSIVESRGGATDVPANRQAMAQIFWPGEHNRDATSVPAPVIADLRATAGVAEVVTVKLNPPLGDGIPGGKYGPEMGLVSCTDLAQARIIGLCPPGAAVASVWPDFSGPDGAPQHFWQPATVTESEIAALPVLSIVTITDGSTSALERTRTILENAYPEQRMAPATQADYAIDTTKSLNGWRQLANVVILTSLPIAGCSLAVAVLGGLSERKRPFSLLRLTGVPVAMLRRVVALESVLPLLLASVAATGVGMLATQLFLQAQMGQSLLPPGADFYLLVALGLVLSLGIIASTLPVLERLTGPETARQE